MPEVKQIKSTITRTSQYGFQLQETGDVWINYGKFYTGNKDLNVGQLIYLEATESNGKLYVNSISSDDYNDAADESVKQLKNDQDKLDIERDLRQILIIKQSSLKAAVEYTQGMECTTKEVIDVAEEFKSWILK
tara:strand:+ start:778 stop:1179 length:402 start_codon:yes stop_codon:yes gene_type:complete